MADCESDVPRKKLKADADDYDLNAQFPIQVLTEIFKHLTANERKVVRLVSKRWNDACNSKCITEEEKFVLSGIYPMKKILEALSVSQRSPLHLEFYGATFMYPSNMWDKCGPKLSTIVFNNCKMCEETLERLIISCKNLSSFVWKQDAQPGSYEYSLFGSSVLPNLANRGFIQENLTNFEATLEKDMSIARIIQFIETIFSIFPNIGVYEVPFLETGNLSLLIAKLLCRQPSVLARLEFKTGYPKKIVEELSLSNLTGENVKITGLQTNSSEKINTSALQIMGKHVESLQSMNYKTAFLHTIFQSCPKLRRMELKHRYSSPTPLNKKFITTLLKSSLNEIFIDVLRLESSVVIDNSFPINRSVRILDVGPFSEFGDGNDESLNSGLPFFTLFSGLEELSISRIPYSIFKTIVERNKNLKSLSLFYTPIPAEKFLQEATSEIYTLKNLESLRVKDVVVGLVEKVVDILDLTNLRHLKILDMTSDAVILKLPARAPILESLSVKYKEIDLSFDNWYTCTSGLKNLRFLQIQTSENTVDNLFNEEKCMLIFQSCSSLRHFEYEPSLFSVHCYFNVLKNKFSFLVSLKHGRNFMSSKPRSCVMLLSPSLTGRKFSRVS